MDNVQKETHVVSAMTQWPLETVALARDEKDGRPSPAPNSMAKTDEGGDKSSKTSGNREESSSDKRSEIPCRYFFFKKKKKNVM